MTPQEIVCLKQSSPALRAALHAPGVYTFLREQVMVSIHWTDADLIPVPDCIIAGVMTVRPHVAPCGRCQQPTAHDALLASPYNSTYRPGDCGYSMVRGWCVACVLNGFVTDAPYYDAYADPDSPSYDPVYANNKAVWEHFYDAPEDYDGPPILMA